MSKLERRLFAGIVLAIVIYVAFALVADIRDVGASLARFRWSALAVGFALASTNYVLRVLRWLLYLDALELRIPRGRAILCFFAGFAMTISPGKIGEVLKSYLLKRSDDIPVATTAPIVIAERLTDVLALLALVVVGVGAYAAQITSASDGPFSPVAALAIVAAVSVLGTVALSHRPTVMFLIGFARRLPVGREVGRSVRGRLRVDACAPAPERHGAGRGAGGPGVVSRGVCAVDHRSGLSGCRTDARADRLRLRADHVARVRSASCPEGSASPRARWVCCWSGCARSPDLPAAVGATYLIRLATLWFAVVIGVVALGAYRVRYLGDEEIDLPAS